MRKLLFIFFTVSLASSCSNFTHYDSGKEFTILESKTTTPFKNRTFEKSITCKECHENIYNEFTESMHYKATIFKDPIHKATWEDQLNHQNKTQYDCAQCHTPAADNIESFMNSNDQAFPDSKNESQNEAISCASCHRIKSIEKHRKANRNIYAEDDQTYYGIGDGMSHNHSNENENELYFNGDVCMGCHSHTENVNDYITNITNSKTKGKTYETCISCHMPQIEGTGTNVRNFKKHFFHGFAGAHNNQEMLAKHLEISIDQTDTKNIKLKLKNKAPHDLFHNPLRKSFLEVQIERNGKVIHQFKTYEMEKILVDETGEPSYTNAIRETKNTLLKGDKTTIITLKYLFNKRDKLIVEINYKLVKLELSEKLGLQDFNLANEIKLFKKEAIIIN